MQNKSMWIGLAATLMVAGCVAQQGGTRGTPERPDIVLNAAGDRVQAVRPDPLVFAVDKSGNGAVVIQWDAPTGTLFAGAGIVVDGQRDPKTARLNREQNQVVKCHVTGNGRQAQCTNVRSQPGTFKYTVLLQRDGKAFPPFDPEIVNKE